MSDKCVLNLDELFGQAQPLLVELEGKEFELRRPESFSPEEYFHMTKLQDKITHTDSTKKVDEEKQARLVENAMDDILRMINPSLAEKKLFFSQKYKILEWYSKQTNDAVENVDGEKNLTGA